MELMNRMTFIYILVYKQKDGYVYKQNEVYGYGSSLWLINKFMLRLKNKIIWILFMKIYKQMSLCNDNTEL